VSLRPPRSLVLPGTSKVILLSVQKRVCAPEGSLFGVNDWNYAYGKNTSAGILRDADLRSIRACLALSMKP